MIARFRFCLFVHSSSSRVVEVQRSVDGMLTFRRAIYRARIRAVRYWEVAYYTPGPLCISGIDSGLFPSTRLQGHVCLQRSVGNRARSGASPSR